MKAKVKANNTLKLFLLVSAAAGVFVGFSVARRSQIASIKALTPESVGDVNAVARQEENGLIPVDLMFRTGLNDSKKEKVSTIAFRLHVYSKSKSTVTFVDKDGNQTFKVETGDALNEEQNKWEVPVNRIANDDLGFTVDFSAVNTKTDGYESVSEQKLGTFYVRGASSVDDLNFEFDRDSSFMYSKRRPVTNIWTK